jgi:hypothetical protein
MIRHSRLRMSALFRPSHLAASMVGLARTYVSPDSIRQSLCLSATACQKITRGGFATAMGAGGRDLADDPQWGRPFPLA